MAKVKNDGDEFTIKTDFGDMKFAKGESVIDDEKWDHASRYLDVKNRLEGGTLSRLPEPPAPKQAAKKDGAPESGK